MAFGLLLSALCFGGEPPKASSDPFDVARPHVRLYGVDTGLPSGTVYNLARDPSGHLWAATQEGAARFDGLAWTPVAPPTAKGPCRGILPQADGTLWLGYEGGGLWRRQGEGWTNFEPEVGINQVLETREVQPGMWATTRGKGVLRWTGAKWVSGGLEGQWVWRLAECIGPDGRLQLWAAGQQGLWVLEAQGWRRVGAEQPFLGEVNAVDSGKDAEGRFQLWVGCWRKGVARWDGQHWQLFNPAQGCPTLLPATLRFDPEAPGGPTLWVGAYDRGLLWFQGGRWKSLGSTSKGDLYGVYGLLLTPDRRPSLWFGARGRGVGYLDLSGWRTLNALTGLTLDSVTTIAGQGDRMWIGATGGMTLLEGGQFKVESGPGEPNTITNGILVEGKGASERIWAATTLGLHLKEKGVWKALREEDGVPEGPAYSMVRTQGAKGDRLWVGSERGLLCLEQGKWRKISRMDGAPGEWVYALLQTLGPEGEPDLWAGMRDAGVARYRKGQWTSFPVGPDRTKVWCNALAITHGKEGQRWLWAAFVGRGLGRLELGKEAAGWRIWGPDNLPGFPTQTVFGVLAHSRGLLFLGTSKGAVRLDLVEGPEGPTPAALQVFTKGDGLPAENMGYYANLVDGKGRIWLGTDLGVGVMDPALAVPEKALPPPSFDRLEVAGASLLPQDGFQLGFRQKRLRTTFFWPVFHRREDARFRTQLVGLENEPGPWQAEAYREFTGLSKGRYTLRLWAKDHAGNLAGPVDWSFEVLPPPWLTWWAFLGYALSAAGLLGAGVRWRLRKLQSEKSALERQIQGALALQEEKQIALEARNQELEDLDETVKAINQEMDLETLIHELLVQISARFPQVQRGMFLLRHETDQAFYTEAAYCERPEVAKASKTFQLPIPAAEAWLRSRPEEFARGVCLVSDVSNLPGFDRMQFPPRALLILPIVIQGVIEGILALHNDDDPKAFEAADLEKLLRFREHIISAVAKARSFQQLDNMIRDLAESTQIAQSAREIAQSAREIAEFEREEARKARAQAEQASQAKSAFLANMSHEIRTPMNAVMGFSQLGQKLDLEPKPRDYFQKIAMASRALLGIINDILDFSKVEAGKLELEAIPFRLAQVVDNVRNLFALSAAEKGLGLALTVEEGTPEVLVGDPLRLGQVLINLTGNAIKFTPAGTVRVVLRSDPAGEHQTRLQVAVIDTGIGLTEAQREDLFQPFSQADSSTTRKFGGTGLGLTISRRLVELMGGKLSVTSEPEKGSTFSFDAIFEEATPEQAARLPLEPEKNPGVEGASTLPGLRVLLVEDNAINQEVAKELLATWGVVPDIASSGPEALRLLETQTFDLVLMDVQMPGMDGYQTTGHIRQMAAHAELPILAMTANALEQDRIACLEAGMNDFVAKPIEPEDLLAALRRWDRRSPHASEASSAPILEIKSDLPLWDRAGALRRLGGNEALLNQLLDDFREEQAGDAETIGTALEAGDLKQAEHLTHTLKGVAGNLGAKRLQEASAALEKALRTGDSNQATALLPGLKQALAATLALPTSQPP